MVVSGVAGLLRWGIPVDPDAPHARQWLIDELSKPEYQAAKPTWFDIVSQAIKSWFASLRVPDASGAGGVFLIVAVIVALALVVTAFLVFGAPRLSRRERAGAVFDTADVRSADQLRSSARAAAGAEDWSAAVLDRFRAVAAALRERTVVSVLPGTTAHEVAERAGVAFPALADELRAAAAAFDAVRYLGRGGSRSAYERIARMDDELRRSRPVAADEGAPTWQGVR